MSLSETVKVGPHQKHFSKQPELCSLQEGSLLWMKNRAGNQPKSWVSVAEASGLKKKQNTKRGR